MFTLQKIWKNCVVELCLVSLIAVALQFPCTGIKRPELFSAGHCSCEQNKVHKDIVSQLGVKKHEWTAQSLLKNFGTTAMLQFLIESLPRVESIWAKWDWWSGVLILLVFLIH